MMDGTTRSGAAEVTFSARPDGFGFTMRSDLHLVGDVIRKADALVGDQHGVLIVGIVLRELLHNAIAHGNRFDSRRHVTGEVFGQADNYYCIRVQDEGGGFDHARLDMRVPDNPQRIQPRGYVLINAVAERITFNAKGNEVTVLVRLEHSPRAGAPQETAAR